MVEPQILMPPTRRPLLDVARFIAAMGVVWLHTSGAEDYADWAGALGRFAVPFFTASSMWLCFQHCAREPNQRWGSYALTRLRRTYVPFLAWSMIYLIATDLKRKFVTREPLPIPSWDLLLIGTSLQLWFLPFVLFVNVSGMPVCRYIVRLDSQRQVTLATMLLIGLAIASAAVSYRVDLLTREAMPGLRIFVLLSWSAVPAVFWGLAVATFMRARKIEHFSKNLSAVAICAVLAVETLSAVDPSLRHLEHVAACGLLLVALGSIHLRLFPWASATAGLAFGIYLTHALFVEAFRAITRTMLHWAASLPLVLGCFVISAIAATVSAHLLTRFRATRWLVS